MRIPVRRFVGVAIAVAMIGCGGGSNPTDNGGGGGGGGGGGAIGTVTIGNLFFQSGHNGTKNPALDTIPAGTAVTWTWTGTGATSHSVQSIQSPSFTSSAIQSGNGKTYSVTFASPGTYHYDCAVHGTAMTGTIVVQ